MYFKIYPKFNFVDRSIPNADFLVVEEFPSSRAESCPFQSKFQALCLSAV